LRKKTIAKNRSAGICPRFILSASELALNLDLMARQKFFTSGFFNSRMAHLSLAVCAFVLICIVGRIECAAQSDEKKTVEQIAPNSEKKGEDPSRKKNEDAPAPQTPPATPTLTLAPETEVEKIDTDLAILLMTAMNKNKQFVTTLQPDDLRVLEDDVPQQITVFERETARPLVLAIVLDQSGSQEESLPKQKEAVNLFLNTIFRPDKDQAMVISFAGTTLLRQPLTSDIAKIRQAVERVEVAALPKESPAVGANASDVTDDNYLTLAQRLRGTALYDSVFIVSRLLAQQTSATSRRAIILLTDGEDTTSRLVISDAIKAASYANTAIYAIGIGNRHSFIYKDALDRLSEETGGRAFYPKHENDLTVAFNQIEQELRSQYVIGYAPTNRARDGKFRQVRIEITNRALAKEKLKLQYRKGYFAKRSDKAPTQMP
jgi:VWFA-related protein